jgi:hypothetical protein
MPNYTWWKDGEYVQTDIPWMESRGKIKRVIVDEGITALDPFAFANLAMLESLSLPSTIVEIDEVCLPRMSQSVICHAPVPPKMRPERVKPPVGGDVKWEVAVKLAPKLLVPAANLEAYLGREDWAKRFEAVEAI